ncbi:MAG: regulatory protein RecX [Gaiella sp.]
MAAVVTALRARGPARVAVDLDGALWRVVPLACVADARLEVGVTLDRERARALNHSLKGQRALGTALRALRAADHSRSTLDERLTARGVGEAERATVLEIVERAGLVDDARLAHRRAATLAERGYGDAAIEADLQRRRLPEPLVRAALEELEPETVRARRIVDRTGADLATARVLTRRGFGDDVVEAVVAASADDGLG